MFEVGWTEMLVIAIVMIVVVGPKDLPGMLRTFGRTAAKLRSMAGDFQKQFNEALKEAELEDVKKSVDALRSLNPTAEIKKQLNPFEKAAADVRAGLDNVMKPKPAADPAPAAVTEAKPAEPLKGEAAAAPAGKPPKATPAFPAMTDASVVASPRAEQAKAATGKKPTKRSAAKTAAPAKAVAAKSPPAKAAPAKLATAKPVAAQPAAAKPVPAKAVAPKAEPVKATRAVAEKKPAAVKKKTAGAAK